MKVYLVTTGEYSAFQVAAVFSTRALAEAYVETLRRRGCQTADVDERELDLYDVAQRQYVAAVWYDDGSLVEPPISLAHDYVRENPFSVWSDDLQLLGALPRFQARDRRRPSGAVYQSAAVFGPPCRTADAAAKAARDYRAKALAEQAGL